MKKNGLFLLLGLFFFLTPKISEADKILHGVSTFGSLKYPASFKNFSYVNPNAPQGGELVLGGIGQFDSFNPYILKGDAAAGLSYLEGNLLHASLLKRSEDETGSSYGYIAEGLEISPDQRQITFFLRKTATFHDGSPILPEDVIFTFEQLVKKGKPFFRTYYKAVLKVEKTGPLQVTFFLKDASSKELPSILGQLPVLSRKAYPGESFSKTSLEPPMGSGPYCVEKVRPGQTITYKKVTKWWGNDVPAVKGSYNFERIRYDYYRDPSVALEAFKAGEADFTLLSSKDWNSIQNFSAVQQKKIIAEVVPHQIPMGLPGFFFNIRKEIFKDFRVRKALGMVLDFEWINKNLMFSTYQRAHSYFSNSPLGATGLPSPHELDVLSSLKGKIPEVIFTQPIETFMETGKRDPRQLKREALALLQNAGWRLQNGQLINQKTGKKFAFEFLSIAGSPLEKVYEAYQRSLREMLGVEMKVRLLDPAQYEVLIQNFDFDMVFSMFPGSPNPGNELWNYLGSAQANQKGSQNLIGIQDPVVDILIKQIINAPTYDVLKTYTKVLDRVLMASFYTVPGWYSSTLRIAYWNKFGQPPKAPLMGGYDYFIWWKLLN